MDKIQLFVTSDVHGAILPYSYADNKECAMGLTKIATYIKQHRDCNSIYIDNGDVLEGNAISAYCSQFNHKNPFAKCLSLAGVDYINLGNHDFNFGQETLMNYVNQFHCISGNVAYQNKPLAPKATIHTFANGKTMALIGVVTQYVNIWEKPSHLVDLTIKEALEFVKEAVNTIRGEVDYICVVYHGGFENDLLTNQPTEKYTKENQGSHILEEIEGIDLLITGHQHRSIATKVNGVTVTQTAFNGLELAHITIDESGIEAKLVKPDCECDQTIMEYVKDTEKLVQQWLDQPLGTLEDDLLIEDEFSARLFKHPIISFFNLIQMQTCQTQLSATALFNDAKGFRKNITMRDLIATYVYPNTLFALEINGKVLKEYLEKCADYWTVKDNQIKVNPSYIEPKPQHYNYDMIDGIEYTIKASNAYGNKIVDLTYQGKPIVDTDVFSIAMNNYRAVGGGEFTMIPNCKVLKEYSDSMVTVLSQYILSHPNLKINHKENIHVIK